MRVIASTLRELAGEVGGWGIGDLTLGLHYLKKAKKREAAERVLDTSGAKHADAWLEEMRDWLDIIEGTYQEGTEEMCAMTKIDAEDVIVTDWKSTTLKPGYYVALLRSKKQVVFAIRGTANMKDALTDLTAAQDDWVEEGERVHRGMHLSVKWFMKNVKPILRQALDDNPGYGLTVVGHSLGGATAALSTLLLARDGFPAKGVVIAPAACLSESAAVGASELVTTFVLADDCVPRFSVSAVEELRLEIVNYPWADEAMDSIRQSRLVRACSDNPVGKAVGSGMSSAYRGASAGAAAVGRGFSSMGAAVSSSVSSMWGKGKGKKKGKKKKKKSKTSDSGSDSGSSSSSSSSSSTNSEALAEKKEGSKISNMTEEEKEAIVPLYPPGKIYKVERDRDGKYYLMERANTEFGILALSDFMFSDHSSTNYIDALDKILGRKPMVESSSDAKDDDDDGSSSES